MGANMRDATDFLLNDGGCYFIYWWFAAEGSSC